MRCFIVLCLVAAACAQSGYNYQAGSSGGNIGAASNTVPSFDVGSSTGAVPSFASTGAEYGPSENIGAASNTAPVQTELEKEFYTFTANDEDFNEPAASNQLVNAMKQALRVIFIKGPENNGLEDAALALTKQAAEQQTAIYVLHKQADLSELANKLQNNNENVNHKPEVHFVKYRTPEDAVNAQKAIQDQYDSLGGKTQHFDGGVAPALNFASQAPVAPSEPAVAAASNPATSATYLPASVLRRFRL
ncbi:uncharacterized protein LOC133329395 [Musca vetustissima]|uniref:uncharacterized protein LOC133329395 n=1 Tax=Musca vetustissima TaxID=27455 RepID=UPI002AB7D7C0|nr:uncharacterized protein LOC133329395 [Musca vetustissima]